MLSDDADRPRPLTISAPFFSVRRLLPDALDDVDDEARLIRSPCTTNQQTNVKLEPLAR